MSNDTVSKFKFFWADQDQQQEQWLREMARQGLHLKSANNFFRWSFVKGEKADIVYRVDFSHEGKNSAYRRLFEDAGWELAAELTGWQYWRKSLVDGQAPEIFTDSESKIGKYRRVLGMLAGAILPTLLIFVVSDPERIASNLSLPFLIPLVAIMAVSIPCYLYTSFRLLRRIRTVRSAGT